MKFCWKSVSCIICSCECGDDAVKHRYGESVKKKQQGLQKTMNDDTSPPSTITARVVTLPPSLESLQAYATKSRLEDTPQSSHHKPSKKHRKYYASAAATKRRLKELVDTSQSV
jgi:hypothetical protein